MAITTLWGNRVHINANCGKHQPQGFNTPVTLLQVVIVGQVRYRFAEFLKAGGGWKEIDDAIQATPKVELSAEELQVALEQAR